MSTLSRARTEEAIRLHQRVRDELQRRGGPPDVRRALLITLPSLSPTLLRSVAEALGIEQVTEEK